METPTLTAPQLSMLKTILRASERDVARHGENGKWQEMGQFVMDAAMGLPDGIGWWAAHKTLGALERKGCLTHDAEFDDLVVVSPIGIAAIAKAEGAS